MPASTADARWTGSLQEGAGTMRLGGGAYEGPYTFKTRFENGTQGGQSPNPEELIAAAHAGCFSMAFAGALGRNEFPPNSVETTAQVHLNKTDEGFRIQRIDLVTVADVPGISEEKFQEIAEGAKKGCPVSVALGAVPEITLDAKLK